VDAEDDRCTAIEDGFEHHWRHFGMYPEASLHDEDGVAWFESPIAHLPYNAVIRSRIPVDEDADAVIERIVARFRSREVPFMWVVRPSDTPADLDRRLSTHGLDLVETATGMDLDLDGWQPEPDRSDADIREVDAPGADPQGIHDYEELIRTYWSVPDAERHMIETLNRHWTGDRRFGIRLVAYVDGQSVGKLFANFEDVPAFMSVVGVAVRSEARGRGVATAMMQEAIRRGVEAGARCVVLHSSEMAHSMYRRMGFVERCQLRVFATAALFGTHHH
jgi:ribosomal protein S18 acetylase RimI-like enzyme